jgi:hypothetical protein
MISDPGYRKKIEVAHAEVLLGVPIDQTFLVHELRRMTFEIVRSFDSIHALNEAGAYNIVEKVYDSLNVPQSSRSSLDFFTEACQRAHFTGGGPKPIFSGPMSHARRRALLLWQKSTGYVYYVGNQEGLRLTVVDPTFSKKSECRLMFRAFTNILINGWFFYGRSPCIGVTYNGKNGVIHAISGRNYFTRRVPREHLAELLTSVPSTLPDEKFKVNCTLKNTT